MNTLRKNAALARYSSFKGSREELKSALQSDEKAFNEDEIAELMEAMTPETGDPGDEHSPAKNPPVAIQSNPNVLKLFYKYKVRPKHSVKVHPGGRREEYLEGYEKVGECLQVTRIEQKQADSLNRQTPNLMVYYFQEGDPNLIPSENVY